MKQDGAILIDGIDIATTRQCCHCNCHFVMVKGSGKRRGFCTRCMQITCGAAACDPCVPFENKLELLERRP